MAVSLVTVPLTVGYLGGERYGAWMTIGSLLAWITIADLGLGNQLTNFLSKAFGNNDQVAAQEAISTSFWILVGISIALLSIGALVWPLFDWPTILNVRSEAAIAEVGPAVALSFVLLCLAFPLAVVDRVYVSFQEGATSNAWVIAGSVGSLAAILVTVRAEGGLVSLVAATAGTNILVKCANALWLFTKSKPNLAPRPGFATKKCAVGLAETGMQFFLVQVVGLVIFNTDNIVISSVLGSEHVTPYAVTGRLLGVTNVFLIATFPYLWAAYGEALARADTRWVASALRRSIAATTVVAAVFLLPLVVFGRQVISVWAGPSAIPSLDLLLWMAGWALIQAPANAIACFLNASGQVAIQARAGLLAAAANIGLSLLWIRSYGVSGVIAATVVSYTFLSLFPMIVVSWRSIRAMKEPLEGGCER